MVINLTPDIESALAEEARKLGTTPESLAIHCLRKQFVGDAATEPSAVPHGTLADFLAGHLGVLASAEHVPGGARLSENTGRNFAAGLVEKRAQGRL